MHNRSQSTLFMAELEHFEANTSNAPRLIGQTAISTIAFAFLHLASLTLNLLGIVLFIGASLPFAGARS